MCNTGFFPGGKAPGREANHSPHLVPESENEWNYNSTPLYAFMAWCSVMALLGRTGLFVLRHSAYTNFNAKTFKLY